MKILGHVYTFNDCDVIERCLGALAAQTVTIDGIVGMPAMVGRVTSLDMAASAGGGVVTVRMNGKTYILDSLKRKPVQDKRIRRYVPYYSLNQDGQWLNLATRVSVSTSR